MKAVEIDRALRDILLLADVRVPLRIIHLWSQRQQREVEDWAVATHLRASGNVVRVPKRPVFLPKGK